MAEKSKIPQPMDSWGAREEGKVVVYVIYMIRYIPNIEGVKQKIAPKILPKILREKFDGASKIFAKKFRKIPRRGRDGHEQRPLADNCEC